MTTSTRPTRAQVAEARAELDEWKDRMPTVIKVGYQWTLLLGLEQNPEIAELAAAGVPQRRIDALYPLEFSNLIPGLIGIIEPSSYAELDGTEKWHELGARSNNIVRKERALQAKLDSETNRLIASEKFVNLRGHIFNCLPGAARPQRSKAMALGIWYTYWGMQNLEGTRWERPMNLAFVGTANWALPDLK